MSDEPKRRDGAHYLRRTPTFLRDVEDRRFFEYDFDLAGGVQRKGLVSIVRKPDGAVTHLQIAFSPLSAVLVMAESVKKSMRRWLPA